MKTIYRYVEDIFPNFSLRVAAITRKSWEKHGFTVVDLSREDAIYGCFLSQLSPLVNKYPTVNHRGYEEACYVRWSALSYAASNCWFMDYDIYNQSLAELPPPPPVTTSYFSIALCYWYQEDVFSFIHQLQAIPPWRYKQHMSDMTIFLEYFQPPTSDAIQVGEYPDTTKPLIHFGGSPNKYKLLELYENPNDNK